MRKPHIVGPIHGNETPSQAIWFDTETDPIEGIDGETRHRLAFGWAAYRRFTRHGKWTTPQWQRFASFAEFWGFVLAHIRPRNVLYLFCHNTSFDLPVVDAFAQMRAHGFELISPVIESPPTIIKWKSDHGTIKCLDTLNFFRMPLAQLGKSVGLNKLGTDFNWHKVEDADAYCRRDVEIIMEAMLRWWDWIKTDRLGGFAPTLAGQAMRAFRHRFMHHDFFAHSNKGILELERDAYCGGRVECWRLGNLEGQWHMLDVNSMFPHIMATQRIAYRYKYHTRNVNVDKLREIVTTHGVVARVNIETNEPAYPVKHEGKLIFPIGRFVTTLSTPEVEYALDHGHIKSVERVACYDADIVFYEYVDYFYTLRHDFADSGNTAGAAYCKILLNALYGKWGQRSRHYEDIGHTPDLSPRVVDIVMYPSGKRARERQFGGLVQRLMDEGEAFNAVPSVAGHTTAGSRIHLWKLAKRAGLSNIAYMDTDALMVNDKGLSNLQSSIHPSTLGALKHEWTKRDITIYGLKEYSAPGIYKSKGVRRDGLWLTHDTVEQDQWLSLKGLLERRDLSAPITRRIVKHLKREYTKGRVLTSGRVVPLELSVW